jgi:hypothetical protein
MESKSVSYHSRTYNVFKASLVALPIYILLLGIVMIISWKLQKPIIGILGWVIISSVPFFYQKRFKQLFTKQVDLEFTDEYFRIKEYALNGDTNRKEITINWGNIKYYKFSFSATNVTYLTIYLLDGSIKRFSFKDEKDQNHSEKELSIFSIFFYFINQFNRANESVTKIMMKPGFLTTKTGEFVIYGLAILDIVAITIHIILNPGTSMFSFMGAFIILGLIVKRKTDKAFFNKINQSNPRSPFV